MNGKKQRGLLLIGTTVFCLIGLSALGLWYKKVVIQSFIAARMLEQRSHYIEARSLLPILRDKLTALSKEELNRSQTDFLILSDGREVLWKIDRNRIAGGKASFTFRLQKSVFDSFSLSVSLKKN